MNIQTTHKRTFIHTLHTHILIIIIKFICPHGEICFHRLHNERQYITRQTMVYTTYNIHSTSDNIQYMTTQ